MTTPWSQAVEELADWMRIAPNNVVPFVGAGISKSANLPTWRELADAMLDSVHGFKLASNEEITRIRIHSPLEVLTFSRAKLGDEMFRRQVTTALTVPKDFAPPMAARLCWQINEQLTVTTNLDDVLERASPLMDTLPAQALTPSDALSAALTAPGRRVLHLHGILSRFDTWVMTDSDYIRAMAVESSIGATLQALLLDRVILFLGYSCNDQNLNLFLDRFKDHFPRGSTMHYALVTNLDDNGRRRLLDYGIFPIEYTPSSSAHPEVSEFLEAVLTKYDPKKAEVFEDERNRPSSMTLLPVPDLRSMSFGARRDRLDLEFDALFEQTSNYALTGSSDLPSLIQYRREETQELLAGVWQVNTVPPTNAIDGREVLSEIGRGGFGVVYLVQDVRSHERQALKVAHFQETSNYKFVHRFKQGIRAMRRLTKHGVKNTTKYLGHREVPLCVFMEYIDGGDLGELIKNVDLDIDVRLQLAREIAEIVAEAHLIPVYHRDLKPSNVLVQWGEDGQPHAILSDFDLAWFEGAISKTTTRIGDQAFASPEQLKEGRAGLQARGESDVYSLGMLIMFLITRHIPSAGQWYNQNLRREVLDIAKRQFSWLHGANLFADLVMLCASEELSARPNVQQVRDVLSKIQEAEKTKLADYEMLIGEIKARLVDQHSDQAIHGSIFHVEYRRNAGRVVIQASFSRQLQVYDDRGRFKFVGDRTLKNLRTKLEKEGWSIQSQASTEFEGKLVVTQEIVSPSLDFAKDCITHLSDGLEYWLRW